MADKVLIVDDDPSICKLLEKVMHSNDLETDTAGSGTKALERLKHHTYDVILMDIMLGDMEGFEVIQPRPTSLGLISASSREQSMRAFISR